MTSHRRTTCDKREFLRPLVLLGDHVADAGVTGVLNTRLSACGLEGGTMEESGEAVVEETLDLPTNVFSAANIPGYSKPDVKPSPTGFHDSWKWGGEPMAEEDTEAPDSEEAESTGGCSWKECDVEWGEPAGV